MVSFGLDCLTYDASVRIIYDEKINKFVSPVTHLF